MKRRRSSLKKVDKHSPKNKGSLKTEKKKTSTSFISSKISEREIAKNS